MFLLHVVKSHTQYRWTRTRIVTGMEISTRRHKTTQQSKRPLKQGMIFLFSGETRKSTACKKQCTCTVSIRRIHWKKKTKDKTKIQQMSFGDNRILHKQKILTIRPIPPPSTCGWPKSECYSTFYVLLPCFIHFLPCLLCQRQHRAVLTVLILPVLWRTGATGATGAAAVRQCRNDRHQQMKWCSMCSITKRCLICHIE